MPKKITMQLIADRLGVSKYTVSQALSGKSGVSHGVRMQIIEMARTLGYRLPSGSSAPGAYGASPSGSYGSDARSAVPGAGPSGAPGRDARSAMPGAGPSDAPGRDARSAVSGVGPSDAVGCDTRGAMPRLLLYMEPRYMEEPDFWRRVLDGLLSACRDYGWTPGFLEHAPYGHEAFTRSPAGTPDAAGLIVVGKTSSPKLLSLRQLGLPMVLIDHEEPLVEADVILNANLEAARMACNHLLAHGCKSVIFTGRDSFAVSFKERWWGCRLAVDEWKSAHREPPVQLKKWTLPYGSPGWVMQLDKRLDMLQACGDALPEAFLCANDQMALQLVGTLQARGISVPDQCRVVGIDNITKSAEASPSLTTVELAKEDLGRRAVQAMQRKLGSRGGLSEKIILSARLIVRQSG
ncbi:LacI family DNA-binding transcriptional regulator [Paenibacillus rigui]|uniref:HTH lacI-type domain-containing protein n=1 Tax=Paenibacillus rigui TaxID=554312 RepID=A0A229UMF5_9BACL|nr:LacI family DNA-binding transcriptional regulator [Paenibacillus rigui]OXM84475.1 hypothetical protein CF651_20185 [Paenibacillus rigui]